MTANNKKHTRLAAELDRILQHERLRGAIAGVSIRKADTGDVIYDRFGDIRLKPASNMKLFTGAAALEVLGTDFRFTTELHADGPISDGILNGDLCLVGKGDPTLLETDFIGLAKELKMQGIRHIKGDAVGDDSWYDAVRLSSGITWPDESYYFGAQVSALTASPDTHYDNGSVLIQVHPGQAAGDRAAITTVPETGYVRLINEAVTSPAGGSDTIDIRRTHGTNDIQITGTVPLEVDTIREWIAVWEPSGYALGLFHKSLQTEGATVQGTRMGIKPATAKKLVTRCSMPLDELIVPFMKLSNNGIGEILAKEMGKKVKGEGSWEAGIPVITDAIAQLGVDPSAIQLRDGSGMSHVNMIPANEITRLLYEVQYRPWYGAFLASLPVAGADGTLRERMRQGAVRHNVAAKTGTLTSVSALSGYVTARNGERLIFSVLVNGLLMEDNSTEDAIAEAIAGYEGRSFQS